MNYKKYRVYINTPAGGYYAATSNTVNNLVDLIKYWLERTSAGVYLPPEVKGTVVLQEIDEATGSYRNQESLPFTDKGDIITKVRLLGAR
jgi:hypothetical protein